MGKHKNTAQNSAMLVFMEQHPDMARGHTKGDRVEIEAKWRQLAESLNSHGPPNKDTNGWKKTWTDWKCEVRKKLAHNKREARATGGGPFSKFTLSEADECLARVSGIYFAVEGISNAASFGPAEDCTMDAAEIDDDVPSTSGSFRLRRSTSPSPKKRRKEPSLQGSVKTFMAAESKFNSTLAEKVDKLVDIEKENRSSLKRVYRSMEKISDTLAALKDDFKEQHLKVLQALNEKNSIKLRQLEIQEIQLKMQQNAND